MCVYVVDKHCLYSIVFCLFILPVTFNKYIESFAAVILGSASSTVVEIITFC